jgi:hypothetical protein
MQIKRLLDDREVFVGDRLFDAQGRSYAFVEHSGGELVVTAEDGRPIRLSLNELGCYVIHVNRTDRGLAKERLRNYWESTRSYHIPVHRSPTKSLKPC